MEKKLVKLEIWYSDNYEIEWSAHNIKPSQMCLMAAVIQEAALKMMVDEPVSNAEASNIGGHINKPEPDKPKRRGRPVKLYKQEIENILSHFKEAPFSASEAADYLMVSLTTARRIIDAGIGQDRFYVNSAAQEGPGGYPEEYRKVD